ncbi:agamous-like mads-box protein agl90 [Phtheirospermum japonicum]|uniref:Agamous-like mads-box protein agl90 n=1 Tax=Phtheirospermum japonicum TaxID=374723 RepID=A0A830CVS8_9LAMI|nr:agamous-like mads-box protein agl90 [Phtheirospermum japonicum]
MVRTKIKYELIADERTRRESFKKRRTGLFKKLGELKTLCDVEACGIVITGDGTHSEIWPSPDEASEVIEKFITQPSSSSSHTNNRVDQIGFLRQNMSRISRNLEKETRKVESLEKELIFAECVMKGEANVSNSHELHEMLRLMEKKIEMVDRRIANIEPF